MTNIIANNFTTLKQKIAQVEQKYQRASGSVQLLAVSKGQSLENIRQALTTGQRAFGENYLQEALTKIKALVNENIEWHFVGAIQSNKTKVIAEHFDWVHTVDRLSIAERLSLQRPQSLLPLNICIQVNADQEETKAGVGLDELGVLAAQVAQLPQLKLRGLMTIPAPKQDFTAQRATFQKLRIALEQLQRQGLSVDTLSMGMSDDFVAAIAEGATIIRVGTALFGRR